MSTLPVISQFKSVGQYLTGDKYGAYHTQDVFSKKCIVVSQLRSTYQWYTGNSEGAWETQKEYLIGIDDMLNSTPVIGHIKGGIHYKLGNRDAGDWAMKHSSRTSGVLIGGGIGFLIGGPIGGKLGGISGGAILDVTITKIDSFVNKEYRPHGYLEKLQKLYENPRNFETWFDTVTLIVSDVQIGNEAGKLTEQYTCSREKSKLANKVGKSGADDIFETAEHARMHVKKNPTNSKAPQVTSMVRDTKTGDKHFGHNKTFRNKLVKDNNATCSTIDNVVKERCAEPHAYSKFNKGNNTDPGQSQVVTVENIKQQVYTKERCTTCKQNSSKMGYCPTDEIPRTLIPKPPKNPSIILPILFANQLRNNSQTETSLSKIENVFKPSFPNEFGYLRESFRATYKNMFPSFSPLFPSNIFRKDNPIFTRLHNIMGEKSLAQLKDPYIGLYYPFGKNRHLLSL